MCCFNFGKKVFSFALTFAVGLSVASVLQNETVVNESRKEVNSVKEVVRQEQENGIGSGINAKNPDKMSESSRTAAAGLRIISKPKASYTDIARQNQTEGKITLRVTFLANGQIGSVSPMNTLPDGLTKQAIAAASKITFEPMLVDGKAVSVTKQVQYNFTIY